jgi:CBS domain-containing protein
LEAGKTDLIVAHADEPLHDAIARMLQNDVGRLPVVDRNNPRRAVGYLGRASILAARSRHLEEEETRERGPLRPFPRLRRAYVGKADGSEAIPEN